MNNELKNLLTNTATYITPRPRVCVVLLFMHIILFLSLSFHLHSALQFLQNHMNSQLNKHKNCNSLYSIIWLRCYRSISKSTRYADADMIYVMQ